MGSQFPYSQKYPGKLDASLATRSSIDLEEDRHCVALERVWRRPMQNERLTSRHSWIVVSRWVDERTFNRVEEANSVPDRHVIGIAMRTARLKLSRDSATVFEGTMNAGTAYVTDASLPLRAELHTSCDFVHLHVDSARLDPSIFRGPPAALSGECELDGFVVRDALIERLARSLIEAGDAYDEIYSESVGQTILMRLVGQRREKSKSAAPKVNPLPRWRLKRVRDYVDDHLSDPIDLAEMASAAGLSRMHFAAQFRAATGSRPHEYLLSCRIERAKEMLSRSDMPLVEVALSTGFQAQAHFSTVFKRLTGQTPAQWRRENMNSRGLITVVRRPERGTPPALADTNIVPLE
jgi:AraC-like DNA-binding protein